MESQAVALQRRHVDRAFFDAAQYIARRAERVVVMGVGKSGLVGRKLSATFSSTGTPSSFVHPAEGMHGDLGAVASRDVVLALSYSGETEELTKILRVIQLRKLSLIALTGRPKSRLGRAANWVINTAVHKEACPHNLTPTSSTIAMLAMGDALALMVMELKNFGPNDFARFHPGGVLGKRLTMRVKDIMHQGPENPLVSQEKKVLDALKVMTRTRLGTASVVDSRKRLRGVFTDGDLRRGLQRDASLLLRPLREVMTRTPRTLSPMDLAANVASLFQKYRLDNFPVVDAKGRPIGVLDEKDLLAEGLI